MEREEGFIKENAFTIIRLILAVVIFALGYFLNISSITKKVLYGFALVICSFGLYIKTIEEIKEKNFINENTLMIIASITAFIIGEYFESVIIIFLFSVGEMLEDAATDKSKEKIDSLSELKCDKVNLISGEKIKSVDAKEVRIGSLISVRKGDSVPIDGVLLSDSALIDYKSITGESGYKTVKKGEKVYSGGINFGDAVEIKTEKEYEQSTVGRIIKTVEDCTEKKAKSQRFIAVFAKYYTPIVVLLAVILCVFPPLFDGHDFIKWIYKALSFLVISCPCALVISVPLAYYVGIGSLAKYGILVKGGNYIEDAAKIKTVVFDKTGTLTRGDFAVVNVNVLFGKEIDVLSLAYGLEEISSHPVSYAIKKFCKEKNISATVFDKISEIAGKGIIGEKDGVKYYIGSVNFANECGFYVSLEHGLTSCVLFDGKKIMAVFYLEDEIKESAFTSINALKKEKIKPVILSGDNQKSVENTSNKLKINDFAFSLLPENKVEKIAEIKSKTDKKIAFIGDGINDAPSIALSDVGIAMGGLGSALALESADVVILDDDLNKVPVFIKAAKKITKIAAENIFFSILVKVAVMFLGVVLKLPLIFATLADVGIMLIAVLNALRCGRLKKDGK